MLHTITDLEIFRAGKWNDAVYNIDDLDAMVGAFPLVGFQPPVKLGHDEKSGDRAFGWISSLKRVGDKLVASITGIPEQLFKLIKERAYDHVSAEIYWDLDRDGRFFGRVLKGIAFLGAETPAVAGLKPISSAILNSLPNARSHTYMSPPRKEEKMSQPDPGQVFLDAVNAYAHQHPALGWEKSFAIIKASPEGKEILRNYGMKKVERADDEFDPDDDPREFIHRLAVVEMKVNQLDYSEAVRKVLTDEPKLKAAYARR